MDETSKAAMVATLAVQAVGLDTARLTGERMLAVTALRFCRAGLPVESAATAMGVSRATLYRRWVELGDLVEQADPGAPAWLVAAADQARAELERMP